MRPRLRGHYVVRRCPPSWGGLSARLTNNINGLDLWSPRNLISWASLAAICIPAQLYDGAVHISATAQRATMRCATASLHTSTSTPSGAVGWRGVAMSCSAGIAFGATAPGLAGQDMQISGLVVIMGNGPHCTNLGLLSWPLSG